MLTTVQRVSVIIPVFNGARYLADAIDSVVAQTYAAIDVVVVDDGSTDGSAAVAEGFGDRVVVVRRKNAGQATAMNTGLAHATGEYVAFLDADDLWSPEKVARQLGRFQARPQITHCVTWVRAFLSPEFESQRSSIDPSLFQDKPGYLVSTLLARRRLFDEIGGFDTNLAHANKTAWFLHARDRGAICEEIREALVYRRLHTDNVSQKRAANSVDEYLGLVKRAIDRTRGARP